MKTLLLLLALAAEPEALVERFYLGAKASLGENASCLEADQRAWERDLKSCKDEACRKRGRLERLATLQALQESVPRDLDLPEVPQLLWVAGEPGPGGTPVRVEGRLEYRGGYYLRTDDGKAVLLIDDLSLSSATAEQLAKIRNESRSARLMARGTAAKEAGFDPRYCVFLYVLP